MFWAALASGLLKVGKALGKYGLEQSGFDTNDFLKPRKRQGHPTGMVRRFDPSTGQLTEPEAYQPFGEAATPTVGPRPSLLRPEERQRRQTMGVLDNIWY